MTSGTIQIGRIRGIEIRVHFTFLLVLPLLAFAFARAFRAAARMANVPAEALRGSPWVWGLAVAVTLFGAVVLHELAHSLYALKKGGRIRAITLMMIGGVSEVTAMPPRPRDEAIMALLGPIVSLAIGVACYLVQLAVPATSFNLRFGIFYLGSLNVLLGLFNLLPAYPMDGGRILRAILTRRMGAVRATEVAARVGKICAVLLGIWGFLSFNVLLMLVAFFVFSGADMETRNATVQALLGQLQVRDVMTDPPEVIAADASVAEVVDQMVRERRFSIAVTDGTSPPGVVTADAVRRVPPERRRQVRAGEIAVAAPTLVPSDEATKAVRLLGQTPLPELLVTDGERLVGSVQREGIARVLNLHELRRADRSARPTWWKDRDVPV
jgi:Zn-dependent protease